MLTDSGNTVSGQIFYTTTHSLDTFVLFTHHWLGIVANISLQKTRAILLDVFMKCDRILFISMRTSFERCPLSSTSS